MRILVGFDTIQCQYADDSVGPLYRKPIDLGLMHIWQRRQTIANEANRRLDLAWTPTHKSDIDSERR